MTTSSPFDPTLVRGDFPILARPLPGDRTLTYLDNAASTQHPRAVIEAMSRCYEESYANVHRGIHYLSEAASELYEQSRETLRAFLNARSSREIIFTSGCTAAINLVARSWGEANLRAGDEILLTEMEHHANIVPWHQVAARTGAKVRFLPITDDGLLRLDLLGTHLTERTKLFAFTAVSNVLGTRNPVTELITAAKKVGAKTLVDAAQLVPHEPIDVQSLDCDFLALSGHKMVGPSGIGVLFGRESLLAAMPPFLGGGGMIDEVTLTGFTSADLPAKFEAGTPPIVPAIGLGAAANYLTAIGLDRIHAHEAALTRAAHAKLEELGGVRFLGPSPELKAGIVSFTFEGVHAHDVAQWLDRHGVAIRAGHHCTMPLHTRLGIAASNRASFYLYNTLEEVEKLAFALQDVRKKFRR